MNVRFSIRKLFSSSTQKHLQLFYIYKYFHITHFVTTLQLFVIIQRGVQQKCNTEAEK